MALTFESFMRKHTTSALSELLLLGTRVPDPPLGSGEALCRPNFSWECTPIYFFVTSKTLGFDVTFPQRPLTLECLSSEGPDSRYKVCPHLWKHMPLAIVQGQLGIFKVTHGLHGAV